MPASGDRTLPQAGSRWPSRLPRIGRYGLAVLSVSAAAALIVTWERHMETAPASLLFCAVMLSAWLGGLRVGLLATVLSLLAFDFYLVSPSYSLAVQIASAPRVVVFALAALFVCLLAAAQKRARQSLQKARDALAGKVEELGNANQALQLENAERCQIEALLRESEQRLRALVVGSVDEIVFEFGADGTYLNIWTSDESLLVRPRSELVGRRAREVMGEETGKAYLEAFGRVLASGRAESQEYPLQLSTGRRWFLSRISPIPAADGSRRTVSVLARDVTERKRGEQRLGAQYAVTRTLAESENLAAATPHLLRGIGDNLEWKWGALWVVDRQSGRLRCRSTWQVGKVETGAFDAISRATEFAPGQGLAGWVWQRAQPIWMVDATSEAELPRAAAAETVGLRGAVAFPILLDREVLGVVEFFDSVARPPDEEQLATLSAIGSQIGQFLRRKRAEEDLRENEKRFRALIEHSSDAILMFDGQGTILYASPPFERVLGYAPEEAVGRNRLSFVEPDQRDDAAADFAGVLQEPGRFATLDRRVRHKDGSWRWLETTVTNWLDEPAVQAVVANVRVSPNESRRKKPCARANNASATTPKRLRISYGRPARTIISPIRRSRSMLLGSPLPAWSAPSAGILQPMWRRTPKSGGNTSPSSKRIFRFAASSTKPSAPTDRRCTYRPARSQYSIRTASSRVTAAPPATSPRRCAPARPKKRCSKHGRNSPISAASRRSAR